MKRSFLFIFLSFLILGIFSLAYRFSHTFASWFWSHVSLGVVFFVLSLLPLLYGVLRIISLRMSIHPLPFMAVFLFSVFFYWSYRMEEFFDPLLWVLAVLGFVLVFFHEKFMSAVRAELE